MCMNYVSNVVGEQVQVLAHWTHYAFREGSNLFYFSELTVHRGSECAVPPLRKGYCFTACWNGTRDNAA